MIATAKRDCDRCRFFDRELFKKCNPDECPCNNPIISATMKAVGDDFWAFYKWAKTKAGFSCKGFEM